MQFCEACGSMMVADGDAMACTNDDCATTADRDTERAAQFVSTETQHEAELIETEEGDEFEGKPTATDVVCDECDAREAWYTIKQTASADEPPTRFFKCKQCGYRWREYN